MIDFRILKLPNIVLNVNKLKSMHILIVYTTLIVN